MRFNKAFLWLLLMLMLALVWNGSGATELGFGGCILASVQRDNLRRALALDERFHIGYVVALGKPAEVSLIEPLEQSGSIKYYRDANGVHHVPKRSLDSFVKEMEAVFGAHSCNVLDIRPVGPACIRLGL